MRTLKEIQSILAQQKQMLLEKYGIKDLGIFGSYVRGSQTNQSDLDLLVDFENLARLDLIKFIEIEYELSDLLGVKVDLVIREDLKPIIGRHVLEEVVPV